MKTQVPQTATALLALMKLEGLGRRGALRAVSGTIDAAARPDYREALRSWLARHGANVPEREFLEAWSKSLEQLDENRGAGVRVLSFHDGEYPQRLREIPDPPAVLFVKGNADALCRAVSLAVVGTREPTKQGEEAAHRAARAAAEAGFAVVSGLARGCDTRAHEGCLAGGGVGVAVLAHGLDMVYPAENRDLAEQLIEQGGCLVSEYPVGARPAGPAFVERDRIQSGLSEGILVIETGTRGGTMHTVKFAREQKRQIACIDYAEGRFFAGTNAEGNRRLLEDETVRPIRDGRAFTRFLNDLKSTLSGESPQQPEDATDSRQLRLLF